MLFEMLLVGGTVYAGAQAYQQIKAKGGLPLPKRVWPKGWLGRSRRSVTSQEPPAPSNPTLRQANQALVVSSTSLGLATASVWLVNPALSLASVPLVLYVFAPTFQAAWQTLRTERRITNQVLDATRITLCVVMRYNLVAALNACLQALSQKFFVQAEADFQRQLLAIFGETPTAAWVFAKGAELQTPLAELKAGDVVAVHAGDTIPADGVVLYGTGWIDQRLVTGAVEPAWKWVGERVLAGSVVQSGLLYVQIDQAVAVPLAVTIRQTLEQTSGQKTLFQQIGERSADRMAPRSLIVFGLTLPLLGVNRAAAFLTTGFGNNLRTLGPYTVRNFLIPAAQLGIVIKDARALEKANLVNTILIDGRVLFDPTVRASAKEVIHALRQRTWLLEGVSRHRFAVHLLVNSEEEEVARQLTAELGLDDYFTETLSSARVTLLERLQLGGRVVCYVGTGDVAEAPVMAKAQVALAWRGLTTLTDNAAQVVLLDDDLRRLPRFFDLAAAFAVKQGFNLATPIGLDLVDLATTILIHLGLVYSVLFNYVGLWLSARQAHLPPLRSQRPSPPATEGEPVPTLPVIDIAPSA